MTTTERDRFELHDKLRTVLGTKEADILMEQLPPSGWADVVRTPDLDMAVVAVRSDLNKMTADLRTELKTEMADLRTDMKSEFNKQTWRYVGTTITMHAATIAAVGYLVSSMR